MLRRILKIREVSKVSTDLQIILAVSDGGVPQTEVVLTNPEPMCKGDAICVQTVFKPNNNKSHMSCKLFFKQKNNIT